ncbi:MAG TPA: DUF3500 domain-containing protein [Bryobacteraceae bacterium]|jgi:hypothetical protein|nr:DUF3500 domain-containing protein [Bryobacteraceae bacterium]
MKSFLIRAVSSIAGLALICLMLKPAQQQTTTSQILRAANTFLSTLDDKQRQAVLYSFDDQEQRKRWSNFPTPVVPRGGISLKQMSQQQRAAAVELLSTVLSPMGLEKVNEIRMADDDFRVNGSQQHRPPGGGPPNGNGGPPNPGPNGPPSQQAGRRGPAHGQHFNHDDLFGSNLYYISFVGKPSTTAPWMLQFGGHHLALNITMAGTRDVMTPTLTGAQPATFKVNGQTIRPVGRESDKGLTLVQSLDAEQRKQAVLSYRVPDLVLGPGQDGKKIAPEGLKVSSMKDKQRALLLDLMAEWVGIINKDSASARMAQLKEDLDDTWFAWSGPTTFAPGANITAYYRIQAPHLVIEYAPQNDEPANHVHTIYRDPTNDYGRQLTGK